jgi:hypothetical protein
MKKRSYSYFHLGPVRLEGSENTGTGKSKGIGKGSRAKPEEYKSKGKPRDSAKHEVLVDV